VDVFLSLICIFCILYDCVSNVNVLLIQPHGCQNVINVIWFDLIWFDLETCITITPIAPPAPATSPICFAPAGHGHVIAGHLTCSVITWVYAVLPSAARNIKNPSAKHRNLYMRQNLGSTCFGSIWKRLNSEYSRPGKGPVGKSLTRLCTRNLT